MPSNSEATSRWLNDIQYHIAMASGFVGSMSYDAFKDDNLRLYAVIRCLEIISEASRRLPDALKARHPSIAWREMAAAGNICGGWQYLRRLAISIGMNMRTLPRRACGALLPSACPCCTKSLLANWQLRVIREIPLCQDIDGWAERDGTSCRAYPCRRRRSGTRPPGP
jgi:uncharacterized protein with HEPN domain